MNTNASLTANEIKASVQTLRDKLFDVLIAFGQENPSLPSQALMAGLGELLMQVSISQVGPQLTVQFLSDLQDAVKRFAPKTN